MTIATTPTLRRALVTALATLKRQGTHENVCRSYREIGRIGSRSGTFWNAKTDPLTCDCALGASITLATAALEAA